MLAVGSTEGKQRESSGWLPSLFSEFPPHPRD